MGYWVQTGNGSNSKALGTVKYIYDSDVIVDVVLNFNIYYE